MPVAAMAMIPAPEYFRNGTAASSAITMQAHTGVCRVGETLDHAPENGSWLSRAIPKHSRIVAARMDRQQTKMAADTTSRYTVASADGKLASITLAGFQPRPPFPAIAVC